MSYTLPPDRAWHIVTSSAFISIVVVSCCQDISISNPPLDVVPNLELLPAIAASVQIGRRLQIPLTLLTGGNDILLDQ